MEKDDLKREFKEELKKEIMDELKNELSVINETKHSEKAYGLIFHSEYVIVEELPLRLIPHNNYDIVLIIGLSDSYNGNVSYSIAIRNIHYMLFNEWKVKRMSMPGDWYGQNIIFNMIDKNGKDYMLRTQKDWYVNCPTTMINNAFVEMIEFCGKYDCVDSIDTTSK